MAMDCPDKVVAREKLRSCCSRLMPNFCLFLFRTTATCGHLDGKHVVFGKVVDGEQIVKIMDQQVCVEAVHLRGCPCL